MQLPIPRLCIVWETSTNLRPVQGNRDIGCVRRNHIWLTIVRVHYMFFTMPSLSNHDKYFTVGNIQSVQRCSNYCYQAKVGGETCSEYSGFFLSENRCSSLNASPLFKGSYSYIFLVMLDTPRHCCSYSCLWPLRGLIGRKFNILTPWKFTFI